MQKITIINKLKTDDTKQIIKFIVVGAWNTIFCIVLYSMLILVFGEKYYLLLAILCNIIAITQSFLCYKLIVFKTKGNFIKEYLRIYVSYAISISTNLLFLYILVDYCHISAIYSNIITTGAVTVLNYLLHKNFTFKKD